MMAATMSNKHQYVPDSLVTRSMPIDKLVELVLHRLFGKYAIQMSSLFQGASIIRSAFIKSKLSYFRSPLKDVVGRLREHDLAAAAQCASLSLIHI